MGGQRPGQGVGAGPGSGQLEEQGKRDQERQRGEQVGEGPPTARGVAVGWGVTGAGCWRWRKMPVAGAWRARGSRTPEPGAAGRLL